MALKDWIQKVENKEDPLAILANVATESEKKPENSHNSHNSHRVSPKIKHSAPVEEDPFAYQIKLAIEDFDRRGITIMDYPEATRLRSLEIEEACTKAANRGDREEFLKLLRQWRECFN